MSSDQLRHDVEERFGDFLRGQGFRETAYEYAESLFGNELLYFANLHHVLRFTRDRGFVEITLQRKVDVLSEAPLAILLKRLGVVLDTPTREGF